jgi:hypothetical protein
MGEFEYKERENKTYEVEAIRRDDMGYAMSRTLYRLWETSDGDWKIIVLDNTPNTIDSSGTRAILLPKKVIDTIIRATVKGELKK